MSQDPVNDSKNEGDSCHPYSSEASVKVSFDNVNLMLFWLLSVYHWIEMSPENRIFPTAKGGEEKKLVEELFKFCQKLLFLEKQQGDNS